MVVFWMRSDASCIYLYGKDGWMDGWMEEEGKERNGEKGKGRKKKKDGCTNMKSKIVNL